MSSQKPLYTATCLRFSSESIIPLPSVSAKSGLKPRSISSLSVKPSLSVSSFNGSVLYMVYSSLSVKPSPSLSLLVGFVPSLYSSILLRPSLSLSSSASEHHFRQNLLSKDLLLRYTLQNNHPGHHYRNLFSLDLYQAFFHRYRKDHRHPYQ